jgi:hypothetical protein
MDVYAVRTLQGAAGNDEADVHWREGGHLLDEVVKLLVAVEALELLQTVVVTDHPQEELP